MSTFCNTVLNALSSETIQRLRLAPVTFEVGHEIEFPGKPITHLYFVEHGMASLTTTFEDGSQVEVGMFGYDSVIGVSALMGTVQSLNRVYTQIQGDEYRCRLEDALAEFQRGERFQTLALRYVQAQLVGAMQSAGCNAAIVLKNADLIAYSRGKIKILDQEGLEQRACECYRVIKNHLDDLQVASNNLA